MSAEGPVAFGSDSASKAGQVVKVSTRKGRGADSQNVASSVEPDVYEDEGDDEGGSRGASESEGEEEEEEEEDEPRLKYQRLLNDVPQLLQSDSASCLCVAEKMLALGTKAGNVYLLDFSGNMVKHYALHTGAVNQLCFDSRGEYIGSCSEDGKVVICGLYTEEKERFDYRRPVKALALDPHYATRTSKSFVSGGVSGQLMLNSRGWLGPKDTVVHSGEGSIPCASWRTTNIAWANELGVRLYDAASSQKIGVVEHVRSRLPAGTLRPQLVWLDDTCLVIAWGDQITLLSIQTRTPLAKSDLPRGGAPPNGSLTESRPPEGGSSGGVSSASTPRGGSSASTPWGGPSGSVGAAANAVAGSLVGGVSSVGADLLSAASKAGLGGGIGGASKYVEVRAVFRTEYLIPGVAPYGPDLVVLAYLPPPGTPAKNGGSPPKARMHAQLPEVRIVTRQNAELASDALPLPGYETLKAEQYSLAHAPFSGGSTEGGQWAAGDEPLYYIVTPKQIIQAKPRDADDHIAWLLQHGRHEKALEAVESSGASTELLTEVGARYLDHLLLEGRYSQAAQLCPKLLRGSGPAWERWVFNFAHLRQLATLAPFVPTEAPKLRETVYETVLNALLPSPSDHPVFLDIVRKWPSNIYNVQSVIATAQQRIKTGPPSVPLQEALAELYVADQDYEGALSCYFKLQKRDVFDFIKKHSLYGACKDKVSALVQLDSQRALEIFVNHRDRLPPSAVVPQLQQRGNKKEKGVAKHLLHQYLHRLFEVDTGAGRDYHGLQVEFYAEYESRLLLPFLRSSSYYPLEKARDVCASKGLTQELVFILGRMGSTEQALHIIVTQLKDMKQAIEFVSSQHDDELWEKLINLSISSPEMVGALLEGTVGHVDPLVLINRLPGGMAVPNLRERVLRIIADYRTETSLRQGCNDILKADIVALLLKYFKEARHAVRIGDEISFENENDNSRLASPTTSGQVYLEEGLPWGTPGVPTLEKPPDEKSKKAIQQSNKIGGSGRCCICLEYVNLRDSAVVAFFCTHAYHLSCLQDSSGSSLRGSSSGIGFESVIQHGASSSKSSEKLRGDANQGEAQDELDLEHEGLRCIMCNTAASVRSGRLARRISGTVSDASSRLPLTRPVVSLVEPGSSSYLGVTSTLKLGSPLSGSSNRVGLVGG